MSAKIAGSAMSGNYLTFYAILCTAQGHFFFCQIHSFWRSHARCRNFLTPAAATVRLSNIISKIRVTVRLYRRKFNLRVTVTNHGVNVPYEFLEAPCKLGKFSTVTIMSPNHKDIYVKAFSTLRMGLPIFEPSIDVQLGDIGFMDENDGLFHKLYNVAEPPVDIHGCPPTVTLVKGEPRYERLDAIHVSFALFLFYWRLL